MQETEEVILITGGSGFIGTNLMDALITKKYRLVNFDKAAPTNKNQNNFWFKGNLLDEESITRVFNEYKPTVVIHLAARTDTLSNVLDDYIDNTQGTENLIRVIKRSTHVKRLIITSTQYVYKSLSISFPKNDIDYKPHTVYGESKRITEEMTRKAGLECTWTIVRPTNIWGPWHMRYPVELWKMIDKGLYVHPTRKKVIRTYGYVKNVVHQLVKIIESDRVLVDKKTFYLGDAPIDSFSWLNAISRQLRNNDLMRIPSFFFLLPSLVGDFMIRLGLSFPIYTRRFNNMVEDYPAPTEKTIEVFGVSSSDLESNVKETISWIKTDGLNYFEYWKNKA
jgi:GlcNAc-P-P-Und epimerase